jgi:hypothetical protein
VLRRATIAEIAGSAMVLISISSLALHGYTCVVAYEASGLLAAVMTFMAPPVSEVYWFLRIWHGSGVFWNSYSSAVAAWKAILAVVGGLNFAVARRGSRTNVVMQPDPVIAVPSSDPPVASEAKGSRSDDSFRLPQLPPGPPIREGLEHLGLLDLEPPTGQPPSPPKDTPSSQMKGKSMNLLQAVRTMSPRQAALVKDPRYLASIGVPPQYKDGYPKPASVPTEKGSSGVHPPCSRGRDGEESE